MQGDRIGGDDAGAGRGEHRVLVVDGVVHEHVQVGDAHPGVLPDAKAPEGVDASGSLGQGRLCLLTGRGATTL